jgi:endo-1,4-beta-xylanase
MFRKLLFISLVALCSCSKEEITNTPAVTSPTQILDFDPAKATSTLRDATDIPIGMAISYDEVVKNDATYLNILKSEFDNIVFGYHMKHGAVVKNDGSMDFSKVDEIMGKVGMQTFGHVLAWHSNNNGDYLRSLEVGAAVPSGVNLLKNGNFEDGSGATFTNFTNLVGGTAEGKYEEETKDLPAGSKRALKATVTKAGANAWDMQSLGSEIAVEAGKNYRVSVAVKSLTGSGSFKLIIQKNNYTENKLTFTNSNWNTYTWNFTATEAPTEFKMHFNAEGSYLIDNIVIESVSTSANTSTADITKKVDAALKTWVQGIVKKYPAVKSWDAINEVFTDGTPNLRTGSSTGDTYYWHTYLGRSYIYKTFQYAKEACSDCEFFINDYNLEYNPAKLDSTIALAKELKAAGVPVAGIGTQMHMSINSSREGITSMMKKLAATGMKVRISELDISINPNNTPNYTPSKADYEAQAAMYYFVGKEYITHIPPAQRHGITIWGISDKDTWIVSTFKRPDYPLMWDDKFAKKPAYMGLWRALKGL